MESMLNLNFYKFFLKGNTSLRKMKYLEDITRYEMMKM
jgi:hypothetical protein